ncbi:MAG: Asp-tRNA(Asn)/Glu-tRNA(Gln) amidotransferase subunit GatB [Spirochaetota bacterium]
MAQLQTYIGLEVHIHLSTASKMFCSCRAEYGAAPNTNVCPVCLGYPGVLPTVNEAAVRFAYIVGNALNCQLSQRTVFERKNYFYPDMTKNYQISQFADPIGRHGWFEFESAGEIKRVRIHDIHLEEDAGKMIHAGQRTLIDYNRAGTPLLEIVTEPDLTSGQQAEDFLQAFRRTVRFLGVSDGNMEEGSLRCDANLSVGEKGAGLGTKVEIKNLNSSKHVCNAMRYEARRQARLLKANRDIQQETRLWDDQRRKTVLMRTKEGSSDYRYFPEPDIPPFAPDTTFMQEVDNGLSELPLQRKQRVSQHYALPEELAAFVCDEKPRADFFERTVSLGAPADEAAKWLKGEVARALGQRELDIESSPLTAERFSALLALLAERTLHANSAREVLDAVFEEDADPAEIIKRKKLDKARTDGQEVAAIVRNVIEDNPEAAAQVRAGEEKVVSYLMGQVMKGCRGSADPSDVRQMLLQLIQAQ